MKSFSTLNTIIATFSVIVGGVASAAPKEYALSYEQEKIANVLYREHQIKVFRDSDNANLLYVMPVKGKGKTLLFDEYPREACQQTATIQTQISQEIKDLQALILKNATKNEIESQKTKIDQLFAEYNARVESAAVNAEIVVNVDMESAVKATQRAYGHDVEVQGVEYEKFYSLSLLNRVDDDNKMVQDPVTGNVELSITGAINYGYTCGANNAEQLKQSALATSAINATVEIEVSENQKTRYIHSIQVSE